MMQKYPTLHLAPHPYDFNHRKVRINILSFCLGFYLATLFFPLTLLLPRIYLASLSFHSSLSLLHRSFYYVFDLSGLLILPKFSPSGDLFKQYKTKDHISKRAYTIQSIMRYISFPHTWSTQSPNYEEKGHSQRIKEGRRTHNKDQRGPSQWWRCSSLNAHHTHTFFFFKASHFCLGLYFLWT